MTIWNKIIQQLVMGDDSSVRLAFHLCTDRYAIYHWTWLYTYESVEVGLPYIDKVGRRMRIKDIGHSFVSDEELSRTYKDWDSRTYIMKIKPKL